MSREGGVGGGVFGGVPRASGDEPAALTYPAAEQEVFPARAGMSRSRSGRVQSLGSVPRASGDEPVSDRVL